MKPGFFKILLLMIATHLFAILASAQKIMMIDDSLKVHSQALTVKAKGGDMLKFEFGPYRSIEAKAGWVKGFETTRGRLFKDDISRSKSGQKMHFVLAGNQQDTAWVKIAVKSDSKTAIEKYLTIYPGFMGIKHHPSLMEAKGAFVADITISTDTAKWLLVIVREIERGNPIRDSANKTILTSGSTQIDIREVFTWSDGRSTPLHYIIGYDFLLNGESIAAVQAPVNRLQKRLVWLHSDLNEDMKLVIAATAAALMEYSFMLSLQLEEFTDEADN